MIIVLISWVSLPALEFLAFTRGIIKGMTGNLKFPTSPVTMIELKAAHDLMESTYADRGKGLSEKKAYDNARAALDKLLHTIAGYVSKTAPGDEQTILSTGFLTTKGSITFAVIPGSPGAVALKSIAGGGLHLSVNEIPGADSYVFVIYLGIGYIALTNNDDHLVVPANSGGMIIITDGNLHETLKGLVYGTRVFVQALAQNSAGKSGWGPISETIIL